MTMTAVNCGSTVLANTDPSIFILNMEAAARITGDLHSPIILIDGRPKASASKRDNDA